MVCQSEQHIRRVPEYRLMVCHFAGFCCCRGQGLHAHQFHQGLVSLIKEVCPPKTKMRAGLKGGDMVLHLLGPDVTLWLHIGWTNLSTWHLVFLKLEEDTDPGHALQATASKAQALLAARATSWEWSWSTFKDLDLSAEWACEFLMLWGCSHQRRRHIQPCSIQARRLREPSVFWRGPPPPPPRLERRRRRRRLSDSEDEGHRPAAALADDPGDVAALPDDPGDVAALGDAAEARHAGFCGLPAGREQGGGQGAGGQGAGQGQMTGDRGQVTERESQIDMHTDRQTDW